MAYRTRFEPPSHSRNETKDQMKECKNCGAPLKTTICKYCGSSILIENKEHNDDVLNKFIHDLWNDTIVGTTGISSVGDMLNNDIYSYPTYLPLTAKGDIK